MRAFSACPRILVLAALAWPQICDAQSATSASSAAASETAPPISDTSHCQAIVAGGPRKSPLTAVCEFALTYLRRLPDFICEQTTTRTDEQSTTVLKAQVTFEKGRERYSDITINGKPPKEGSPATLRGLGFISAGELGSNLLDLFTPPIVAEFQFRKEANLRHIPSLVYEFHIPAKKNTFWAISDSEGVTLHPEYLGGLWLERQSGRLLQLKLQPVRLPGSFGFASAEFTIDYSETSIADAGVFLLPSASETKACMRYLGLQALICTKNVLVFHDCRKFGTTTRILTDNPRP